MKSIGNFRNIRLHSVSRPHRVIEVDDGDSEEVVVKESADPDARWLKKGYQSYFGYRGYIRTDAADGYIESVHAQRANKTEVRELARAIYTAPCQRIYADKGFASRANRKLLKERGLKDGLMEKALRNRPLKHWQKVKNRLISTKRFVCSVIRATFIRPLAISSKTLLKNDQFRKIF